MRIRQLPDSVINQIAAGEVVERPASVVKELLENALDAGATLIETSIQNGGLSFIRIEDNGSGMGGDELPLAVARHCTSKLSGSVDDIRWLGFRGEALPSIGSVSRLRVMSRPAEGGDGAVITVTGGAVSAVTPAALNRGTIIEVRDLFFTVPARLKFMRTPQAEATAVSEVVRRMALARPDVHFSLSSDIGASADYPSADGEVMLEKRIRQVMGADFAGSAIDFEAERDGMRLYGFISPPAQNRANGRAQFAFVNGRAVKDRQILGAIAGAYADRLPRGRHASAVLFFEIDPRLVDVNVHPAKAEVRFRDPGLVRGLIVGGLRQALDAQPLTADRGAARALTAYFRRPDMQTAATTGVFAPLAAGEAFEESPQAAISGFAPMARTVPVGDPPADAGHRLGAAKAQLHRNYIVTQTEGGLVIVDQHAAHERLVYEALKRGLDADGAPSQRLLIPEIVTLGAADAARVLQHAAMLERFGLLVEGFGNGAIAVSGTPSMLGEIDAAGLLQDIADEIAENDTADGVRRRLDALAATIACHGSVRSGRELRVEEMNALLRQMEATPGSDTCNHGRPTFVELTLADIERLFERR